MKRGLGKPWRMLRGAWRHKVGVRLLAALLTVSFLFATISILHEYDRDVGTMRDDLLVRGRSLARQTALALPDLVLQTNDVVDYPLLDHMVEDLVNSETVVAFAIVTRKDGKVLASFPAGTQPVESSTTLLVGKPILLERGSDVELGSVQLGLSLGPGQLALRRRTIRLLLNTLIGFVLAGGAMWLVLRKVVIVPIGKLDAEAQRLGRGELETPIGDFGEAELGRLGRTLDQMRQNLRTSYSSLETQNRQLQELDRLKTEFLTNVSHEMRTPLTTILGRIDVLHDVDLSDAERRESVEALQRNGEQLFDLVDRLLDLGKLETGRLLFDEMPCRPAEIVAKACRLFLDRARSKDVELRIDTSALDGTVIRTDPDRLQQLVRNIVGNAVKFTDAGTITVQASMQDSNPPRLQVVVTDTGRGISPEFLDVAFQHFRQQDGSLTRLHGGSGLGLYMTRKIARLLGGDVQIASEMGRGTRVEITIAAPATVEQAKTATPARMSGRVLVVDDARDTQRLLQSILTRLGLTVELAENGRIAIECVESSGQHPFDLVLMDLQMPEVDGLTAIRTLRAKGFGLPIVSLTAHALADDRERCFAAGATGYETKPISRQRLAEVVARYVPAKTTDASA